MNPNNPKAYGEPTPNDEVEKMCTRLDDTYHQRPLIDQTIALLRKQAAQLAELQKTINFFASVIKSGEKWSAECDAAIAGKGTE